MSRCPVCDREAGLCDRHTHYPAMFAQDMDAFDNTTSIGRAIWECESKRVDWRERALSAESRTVSAIAEWLDKRAAALVERADMNRERGDHGGHEAARSYAAWASECAAIARHIRSGAWKEPTHD